MSSLFKGKVRPIKAQHSTKFKDLNDFDDIESTEDYSTWANTQDQFGKIDSTDDYADWAAYRENDNPIDIGSDWDAFQAAKKKDQIDMLRQEGFVEGLDNMQKQALLNEYKKQFRKAFGGIDETQFTNLLGKDFVNTLDTDIKDMMDRVFKSDLDDRFRGAELGPSRAAGLLPIALSGLSAGLGYKNLRKARDAAKDYEYVAPRLNRGIAAVRPVRSIAPEIVSSFMNKMAHRSFKSSDPTANVINNQMSQNQNLQAINELANTAADYQRKEFDRYDQQRIKNVIRDQQVANEESKIAAELKNRKSLADANVDSRYWSGKGKWTNNVINKSREALANASEFNQKALGENNAMAKENLIESTNVLQDALENDMITDSEKETMKGTLTSMIKNLTEGNYTPYQSKRKIPGFWDMLGSYAGVNHVRPTKPIPEWLKNGGKLLPKKRY